MSNEKNPYYNQSGCADPTAYKAVKAVSKEDAALEGRKNFLIKVLKYIINNAGFELINRIELRDNSTVRSSGSQLHRTTALPFLIKIFGLWFWSILFDFKIDKSNFFYL